MLFSAASRLPRLLSEHRQRDYLAAGKQQPKAGNLAEGLDQQIIKNRITSAEHSQTYHAARQTVIANTPYLSIINHHCDPAVPVFDCNFMSIRDLLAGPFVLDRR